ncbi:MFS transporter [Alicyclobacillus macrosporangiidus]|uniref:Drug resistance transporter, EmrB/QacA subfamily n=1 Tax=Alicyclobacillus macrosporangiidus TaxID=392015 RepID=A0A1I7LGZ9_9BACL|nr:MFS transporter [Alicyclobacillus macrosporangiidus]SFV08955.1 drug resistance transporter, EmrB/QacA subfamily [Alicyclobacillus macrosporangiidus]
MNTEKVKSHKWWALTAVCFGLFMALLDVTIVNVALPTIQASLNAPFSDLEWVIDAYALSFAVVLITSSRLGDILGRKKVFITGLFIFSLGSLFCALSGDFTFLTMSHIATLDLSRAIQGLGASAMMPLSLSIISTEFHGKERGAAFGIWGGVSGLATAVGPLVGGILVLKVNWQSIFYINVPIGVIGILLSLWAIRESKEERAAHFIDVFGLITLTVSMLCLVLALLQGNEKGWSSGYILTLLIVAAVFLVVFIVGEMRIKNPMIDPRLFKNPSFTGSAIAAFTLSAGFYSLFFYLTLFLQNYLGFDSLQAGLRTLPMSALVLLGAPLAGRLTDKFGPKWFLVIALALLSIAVFLMTRISPVDTKADWIVLLPSFIIAGIANGMVNPPLSSIAMGTVHPTQIGMASGVNNVSRQIGIAFGVAFLGAMLTTRYNHSVQGMVNALSVPGLTEAAKQNMIAGVQKAGTIAGSMGLPSSSPEAAPYVHNPAFPTLQHIARTSFIHGTVDVLVMAGSILAIGALLCLILIRDKDMVRVPHAPERQPE